MLTRLLFSLALVGCAASTPRIDAAYHPSPDVYAEPPRIAASAVEAQAADVGALVRADGHYVGELELEAKVNDPVGVASHEAAAHGATHLLSFGPARFALYRVEHDRWRELPASLRPRSPEPVEARN